MLTQGPHSSPHRAPGQCQAFKGRASGTPCSWVQVRFPMTGTHVKSGRGNEAETTAGEAPTASCGSSTDPSVTPGRRAFSLAPRAFPRGLRLLRVTECQASVTSDYISGHLASKPSHLNFFPARERQVCTISFFFHNICGGSVFPDCQADSIVFLVCFHCGKLNMVVFTTHPLKGGSV